MCHRVKRIPVTLARTPFFELACQIGRWLSRKRRITGAHATTIGSVACGTCLDPTHCIPVLVQPGSGRRASGSRKSVVVPARYRQCCIVIGNLNPRRPVKATGNPAHLGMPSLTRREVFELTFDIPGVESGEPGREIAIALPFKSVASDASASCARIAARERNQLSGLLVRTRCGRFGNVASGEDYQPDHRQRIISTFCVCTMHSAKLLTVKLPSYKAA